MNLRTRSSLVMVALVAALAACAGGPSTAGPSLQVRAQGPTLTVLDESRPVLVYRSEAKASKPYVLELYTRGGRQILRDAPADHSHHHALMLAVGVDAYDFWSEAHGGRGRQRAGPVETRLTTAVPGVVLRHRVDWIDPEDDRPVLHEDRELEVPAPREKAPTLLTWRSRLRLPPDKAVARLWGRHYFGLGMRFVTEMDGSGRFLTAGEQPEKVVRGDERLTPSRWCAYIAPVDGHTVTVAMFDHPQNLRHPATWFTMAKPFAYLAATLALETPMEMRAPFSLRYGIALWDGAIAPDRIEQQYRDWLDTQQ